MKRVSEEAAIILTLTGRAAVWMSRHSSVLFIKRDLEYAGNAANSDYFMRSLPLTCLKAVLMFRNTDPGKTCSGRRCLKAQSRNFIPGNKY